MMLPLLLALAAPADWVPVRWSANDPKSLDLVRGTAVNCLLLEQALWSPEFGRAAADAGIAVLGVVRPGAPLDGIAGKASAAKLAGVVLEGDFDAAALAKVRAAISDSRLAAVEMVPRTRMKLDGADPIVATYQGVWPGINAHDDGSAKAAPSGAPWIDTNSGFLRFLRASTKATVWIGNVPPVKTVIPAARYLQAIADAGMLGARWVVALDDDLARRLHSGDAAARKDWRQITGLLDYFAAHPDWRSLDAVGALALVQDARSGGLLSGGILDMISVKHTPVRPVPNPKLSDPAMKGAKMAVDVDPGQLSNEQKDVLRRFTRGGGTLLTAPPGWKFSPQRDDQITLSKEDIEKIDQIWKEVNSMTGRHNLGARLFNVASMLSHLSGTADGKRLVLQLVNYSDYPVEGVTAHFLGKWTKIRLLAPGVSDRVLAPFEIEDGTGVEIDKMGAVAALVLE